MARWYTEFYSILFYCKSKLRVECCVKLVKNHKTLLFISFLVWCTITIISQTRHYKNDQQQQVKPNIGLTFLTWKTVRIFFSFNFEWSHFILYPWQSVRNFATKCKMSLIVKRNFTPEEIYDVESVVKMSQWNKAGNITIRESNAKFYLYVVFTFSTYNSKGLINSTPKHKLWLFSMISILLA